MDHALRQVRFHGLYHVPEHAEAHANLGNVRDSISVYLRCASLCSESFRHAGYDFTLVTNRRENLERRLDSQGLPPMQMVERRYETSLPLNSAFYSAHFKLDLIKDFASGAFGEQPGLVDIDTVLVRPFKGLAIPDGGLIGYDLSSQVKTAYRADVVASDVARLAGLPDVVAPSWWGGEFIVGSASSFAALGEKLDQLWPRYIELIGSLHHTGDEIVTTAALTLLLAEGARVQDAGRPGGIARWWSSRTLSPMLSFREVSDRSLMHLPADKPFLSAQAGQPFDPDRFLRKYRAAVRRKLAVRRIGGMVERLAGSPPYKVMPRLT